MVSLVINGVSHHLDVPETMPLLWAIRDVVGLTGTKFGCGVSACGGMHGAPRRRGRALVFGARL